MFSPRALVRRNPARAKFAVENTMTIPSLEWRLTLPPLLKNHLFRDDRKIIQFQKKFSEFVKIVEIFLNFGPVTPAWKNSSFLK